MFGLSVMVLIFPPQKDRRAAFDPQQISSLREEGIFFPTSFGLQFPGRRLLFIRTCTESRGMSCAVKEFMGMKRIWILIIVFISMGIHSFAVAQTNHAPAEAPTSAPASAPAESEEYELPEGPPGVVARVGETEILARDVETILDKIPYRLSKKKREQIWNSSIAAMVNSELLHAYLEANKAPDAPDELAAMKKTLLEEVDNFNQTASLRLLPEITLMELMEQRGLNEQKLSDQARYEKLRRTMTSNEAMLAFMDKHPDYFNGTKVHIGHIFLPCSPLAPTEEQNKAVEKLRQIAAEINTGKVTFAQAAHEYSQCPSGRVQGEDERADYGDLGDWTFPQLMMPFGASAAMAAFNADAGTLCDVVRSNQKIYRGFEGFHLIKVFERTKGNESRGPQSADIAGMCIFNLLENQIFKQTVGRSPQEPPRAPIVIFKAAKDVPRPKEE
jgi:parvulin-like peptidyl-prolyl isomerase